MRYLCVLVLAMTAGTAEATSIWLSTSDVASPLGEVPLVESATGTKDQMIHIWARPDTDKTLSAWSLNLRSTNDGVVKFTNAEVINPLLSALGDPLPVARYASASGKESVVNPNLIQQLQGFSFPVPGLMGAGIGPATKLLDPFYSSANDAWLLASVTYDVIGPGSTDLFLQIGANGILNRGERTRDQNVIFGNPRDPALNGEAPKDGGDRGRDSATPEVTIVAYGDPVISDSWRETGKITAENRDATRYFGSQMATSGNRMVVSVQRGSRVLERSESGWNEVASLNRSGRSLAISDNRIIVGDERYTTTNDGRARSGAAYLFEDSETGWQEVAVLAHADAEKSDRFGASVGIFENHAIVGAPHDSRWAEPAAGSAHFLERGDSNWAEIATLAASDGSPVDRFGEAVAISDGWAVVGASGNDTHGEDSGAAYVFGDIGGTWAETAKLIPSDLAAGDRFGRAVAASGNRVVVGAPNHADNGENSGAAYIFERSDSGWNEVAKLTARDGTADDFFGNSVAMFGDRVVVGAPQATLAGTAYVFERSGSVWDQVARLGAHDAVINDGFGRSLAISGDSVLASSPWNDDFLGSIYVFAPPDNFAVQLITGTSVSLSQTVDAPAETVDLVFDYRFLGTAGDLEVLLDGISLGTIAARGTAQAGFATASLSVDGSLLSRTGASLEFVLDGPAGSRLLLDNIEFPSLVNGDFQTRDTTGWTAAVAGGGSIEPVNVSAIPEPSGLTLALLALAGLLAVRPLEDHGRRSGGRPDSGKGV
ncbi:MAG: FG-GAP repeat protein [Pirellulales bacterium]